MDRRAEPDRDSPGADPRLTRRRRLITSHRTLTTNMTAGLRRANLPASPAARVGIRQPSALRTRPAPANLAWPAAARRTRDRLAKPIRLGRLDMVMDEAEHVRTPLVAFCFVPADLRGKQGLVLGLLLGCARFFPLPATRTIPWLRIRCFSRSCSSTPVIVSVNPWIVRASEEEPRIGLWCGRVKPACAPSLAPASAAARSAPRRSARFSV